MGNGFKWGAFAFLKVSTADVDGTTLTDGNALEIDEVSLDGKAACEVRVAVEEDDGATPAGDVVVYLMRGSQTAADALHVAEVITPEASSTREKVFSVPPGNVGSFKPLIDNGCGQTVKVTAQIRTATIGS